MCNKCRFNKCFSRSKKKLPTELRKPISTILFLEMLHPKPCQINFNDNFHIYFLCTHMNSIAMFTVEFTVLKISAFRYNRIVQIRYALRSHSKWRINI